LTPFKRDGLTYYTAKAGEFTGEIQQVTITLK